MEWLKMFMIYEKLNCWILFLDINSVRQFANNKGNIDITSPLWEDPVAISEFLSQKGRVLRSAFECYDVIRGDPAVVRLGPVMFNIMQWSYWAVLWYLSNSDVLFQ